MTASLRLVVFDWDGTLLDSIASIVACTQATLEEIGLPKIGDEAIRAGIGLGVRETVERFVPGCDEKLFREIRQVYRRHWFETHSRRPVLFDGVVETLQVLAQRGLLLAVATAKGREGLELDFARTGIGDAFQSSRTMDESPSKPHPEMLFDILGELGVVARDALMIGDSVHDMQMASNAGVAAVGVLSGSQTGDQLAAAQPLVCLPSVNQLPAWLER